MTAMHHSSLFDALQAEFSPPLDSSLIAAIIADYDVSTSSNDQLPALREVLSQLAAQAEKELVDEDNLTEQLANVHISYSVTDDTTSSHDVFSPHLSPQSSHTAASSSSDTSSQHSFSSPLGFLQAAFPHVPTAKLRGALNGTDDADSVDMESVVENLLSGEFVRELEERGLDGMKEVEAEEEAWMIADSPGKRKKASASPIKVAKKGKKRGPTFTFGDVRQKQLERPSPTSPRSTAPDPWTQLSSVASYLSTLLPTHPASYFLSAFHSPDHSSPAKALRAVLRNIATSPSSTCSPEPDADLHSAHTAMLFSMFDVLRASPEYSELNAEERDQMMDDGQLTLQATHGQPDCAIDLVWLLRDLERDCTSGEFDWGVYHSPAPARPPPSPIVGTTARTKLPTGPPPIGPPPRGRSSTPGQSAKRDSTPSPPNAWKTIPQRQPMGPHPLAESIPAYRKKVRGVGNGNGKGGKGELGGKQSHSRRIQELAEKRREMLRQAGRAWQKGSAKTRGGEVAFYYAERARELQQEARDEQLDAAREMVHAKRVTSLHGDTMDLHGTTVAEAVHIVRDILHETGSTQVKPLRIITGRGTHSANGVGVLGPAVRSALEEDGWNVRSYAGGLIVSGRKAWRSSGAEYNRTHMSTLANHITHIPYSRPSA